MTANGAARRPALFLGHGNPLTTLTQNRYTETWAQLGRRLRRPRAILAISAHWVTPGVRVTAMAHPPTIHDFVGFPAALSTVTYDAPGDPDLARDVIKRLSPYDACADYDWGLDHGTWTVLRHLWPTADVPVVQLSLAATLNPRDHYRIGQALRAWRDDDVLFIATGNVVHNLARYRWRASPSTTSADDWAIRFERRISDLLVRHDHDTLIDYSQLADATRAIPTPEHYWPLLYVLGLQRPDEAATVLCTGIEGDSLSMLSAAIGTLDDPYSDQPKSPRQAAAR